MLILEGARIVLSLVIGFASGLIVAGGVGALFTTVGVVVRLAFISGTGRKICHYENCIILGTVIGVLLFLYRPRMDLFYQSKGILFGILWITGAFMGTFVGCLAMALSETLDISTVYFRRIKIKRYIWIIILAIAVGKFLGALV